MIKILWMVFILNVIFGGLTTPLTAFDKPIQEEKRVELLDGVSPIGTVLTEVQLQKDMLIIAENCCVLPLGDIHDSAYGSYGDVYWAYKNNGNTSFTFPEEDGYQNGGVTLDITMMIAYDADDTVGRKGCIEVEYVFALWKYFSERVLPINVDAINVNFEVVSTYFSESGFAFTRFSITESEALSLFEENSANEMNETERIKSIAKIWCEKNNYQRNDTSVQPYTY